ncbi:hypothetical protein FISHEDRAFT_50340 [Fistulina hepatica ATCC 64428]|uniref:HECT-type E3 ubiquitin transferase n=1 Tax=Fistulina hepatica ATCC 64428 TaxID=1128425 RepID=A0A0D7A2B6_9AGAR|nr:hypothetical protein FISHEDRAFT_50340 [Fistulina hepatica ATCC 64428]
MNTAPTSADGLDRKGDDEPSDDEDDHGDFPSGDAFAMPEGLDEAAALGILGGYRQFGSYMLSLSSRLKSMLNNIKATADPTTRLMTLQELSELLSISTEDTLAGSFPIESFVKELVRILGGRESDDEGDDDSGEQDEDAALAAALAMSTGGGAFQGDENLEAQVLACRCLANLMEALPGVAHTVVYHGAIRVLCSKLTEISYIDLAEQTLSTMEKISEEFPSAIVREGGLAALLNYLDFFSIAVQRTALQAASNCCRNMSPDNFSMIKDVWPIIRNCLSYADQRLVEFACVCVIRVIDSFHRNSVQHLEALVDTELIKAVNLLLLPAGGSPLIASNTFTLLLRGLATSTRASPKITLVLLQAGIVHTLYQILTGVLLPVSEGSHGADGFSGVGDMVVMENLAHRPKEQVEEALSLISELMPPLPKDGVFDHKSYTEKALARLVKAKVKADRAAARQAAQAPLVAAMLLPPPVVASPQAEDPIALSSAQPSACTSTSHTPVPESTGPPNRTALLRENMTVVTTFMELIVPILIEVYAASVATTLRVKTLTALLKAVSFLDADGLAHVLKYVPVAAFASSILSSKDHPSLVLGALQLVDLLLGKLPAWYKPTFRREGVFHEIEMLAERPMVSKSKTKEKDSEKNQDGTLEAPPESSLSATLSSFSAQISAHGIPGYRKLSSMSIDPEDAITARSRVTKFKYISGDEDSSENSAFDNLRSIVQSISSPTTTEAQLSQSLHELADQFASPYTSVSSFELLQSGVVDGLLSIATDKERTLSVQQRRELLLEAFAGHRSKAFVNRQSPFAVLVKKLQECLTRMESFDVVTVSHGTDDSKRSSPSLLARQLRLRLESEDSPDVPKSLNNIVVSIHAIATFQALHDYLRPRVAGIAGRNSRISGMLAALAASGFRGTSRLADELANSGLASAPSAPATSASAPISRRRSQRLNVKRTESSSDAASTPAVASLPNLTHSAAENQSDSAPAASLADALTTAMDEDRNASSSETPVPAEITDDEVDAEVFDDEMDQDNGAGDRTINLSVADDGANIEAQTPDGTRIATPFSTGKIDVPRSSLSKASYAAAAKSKPNDWHLEFSMGGQVLPLDLTVYGAVHQSEMRKAEALPPNLIWQGIYDVKFKKVPGPQPTPDDGIDSSKNRPPTPITFLPEDMPHTKTLKLLRVLHDLNTLESERATFAGEKRSVTEAAFVNNKLTAKLTRQLEEPMIVASSCLPDWALDLPQHFPFLFPFSTRYNFLQSTSFGYARLILKWQSQQTRGGQDNSRRDDGIGFLGRLQRQKVRISRKHILESAVKVFELYGSSSSVLEVEYFEEVGTGLGPTLEFYSLVSQEFVRKDLKIWRDVDANGTGQYVSHPSGLYPSPIGLDDLSNDNGLKRTQILRVVGQFVAKAMLDSRIIDLSFNKVFMKLVLGEEVPVTLSTLKLVDIELAKSLVKIQSISVDADQAQDKVMTADLYHQLAHKVAVVEGIDIADLALDFTIPGYDIELMPGGRNVPVTKQNFNQYIEAVLDAILGKGIQAQVAAFREGFSKVFPIADLRAFTADELVMLFGSGDEDWSIETLSEAIKADHGFNVESRAIRDLIDIMSKYDGSTRRSYLQFITGSPKLPIGGFRGLNPPLTVVRKPHEAPLTADDYLPSVMTCVNYLKLPEYSSKEVMEEKLRTAMMEGIGSFHLS